jgi:hypothetical protein
MPGNPNPLFPITLNEFEKIVSYGVARQTWSVYREGRWLAARLIPGAVVNSLPSKPGVIWERSVELSLESGAKLERTSETPRPHRQLDAFAILTLDQRSQTLTRKSPYQVTAEGRLTRIGR